MAEVWKGDEGRREVIIDSEVSMLVKCSKTTIYLRT